jgi:ribosomal protein S21
MRCGTGLRTTTDSVGDGHERDQNAYRATDPGRPAGHPRSTHTDYFVAYGNDIAYACGTDSADGTAEASAEAENVGARMIVVSVDGESIDTALRRLKKLREHHGIPTAERRHQYARSRSERRREKIARARKRRLSDAARQARRGTLR